MGTTVGVKAVAKKVMASPAQNKILQLKEEQEFSL